jgi:FMN-dependent oxidoreductase (nitrilotriacetate monooxygenase family)
MPMVCAPFHLAWFVSRGYGPKAWRYDWAGDQSRWMMPDLFVDLAKSMERAGFDYVMMEDSCNVPYTYQGTHDVYLKYAMATPKLDPAVLVPYMAAATKRIGLVTTMSTTEYPPFLLARLMNSLDHVTEGRAGWNMVTGSNDGGAQNYGMDRQIEHDERYDRADEFAEIVTQLWESWDPDAMVLDPKALLFADGSKVHAINYQGRYHSARGPLSAPRSPQVRPVLCQAGGSSRGRRFAARWSDTIITAVRDVGSMKATRERIRADAVALGRDPDGIKVLFLIDPLVDHTAEAAEERRRILERDVALHRDQHLASLSRLSGIDFAQFPLDEPLPKLLSNGHQSMVDSFTGRTPRQLAMNAELGIRFTGTVDQVAGMMEEAMQEAGGDGFLIVHADFTRRYIAEICDGLVPELQRRGLTRRDYPHRTFRENLMAF